MKKNLKTKTEGLKKIYIPTPEALALCERKGIPITIQTLRTWCERYDIGKKVGGRWVVNRKKLLKVLAGDQNGE